jgi:hypothetical protein
VSVAVAWLLPMVFGVALWQGLGRSSWRTPGAVQAAAGHALVLGLAACGLTMWLPSLLGWPALPAWAWLWPALPAAAVAAVAWMHRRPPAQPGPEVAPCPTWLWLVVLSLIGVRALWLLDEAWLRPLFAWDGWVAWSAKARAWSESGVAGDFVSAREWIETRGEGVRTSLAPHYPELLSWIQVWLARAAGAWSDGGIGLAWPLLWLALLAGCHGQWRALAVPGGTAAIALYALASLPLLTVHGALPGYADAWVATCLVFAALGWLRWRERGERGQLHLALLFAGLLPLFKFEGAVWAIGILVLALWFALERHRWPLRMAAAGVAVLVAVGGSWLLELAWLLQLQTLFAQVGIDQAGSILVATARGLFVQDNWHLLWYLLPVLLIWRGRILRGMPEVAGLAILLCVGLLLVVLLFVLSQAGRWAESFTAVNRLVLQLAPLAVTVMALALRPARWRAATGPVPVAGAGRESAEPATAVERGAGPVAG